MLFRSARVYTLAMLCRVCIHSLVADNRLASSEDIIWSSFHISGASVSGTLGRIKDSPQDITVRSCSHSFPSPSINRSITSFSGLIVGVGDGDGVTEGVGVEDGIGVTEGVGVEDGIGVPSGVEVTVGVGDSSDAITFSESEAAGKVFSVSVMHESSSPELKISSKLSGVPNSAACTGTVAVISATVRNTDRKSTRLNSSHQPQSRMPSSA